MSLNPETVFLVLFILLLVGFVLIKRKNIQIQKVFYPFIYVIIYRSKIGLKLMDRLAKKDSKFLKITGYVSIVVGFVGMAFLCYTLVDNLIKSLIKPVPGIALVLPFKVKGTLYVPFTYWIISIIVLAAVHEFCHGIYARLANLRIKSSGFAFVSLLVPILPAAFVEPDEKKMQKKSLKERLAIFSAGPFSNIALAALLFLIYLFVGSALAKATLVFEGVEVTDFIKDANTTYPAELAGMSKGEIITKIDGMPTQHIENFTALLKNRTPGSVVQIESMKNKYNITLAANPLNSSMPYLGVYVRQNVVVNQTFEKKYGSFLTNAIMWFNGRPYVPGLMYWLIVLNLGIGLFNLIPIGPIDGGRMMHTVLHRYLKKEKAEKIARFISSFFLMLILINLAMGFFVK